MASIPSAWRAPVRLRQQESGHGEHMGGRGRHGRDPQQGDARRAAQSRPLCCGGPLPPAQPGAQSQKEGSLLLLTFPSWVPKPPCLDNLSGNLSTMGPTAGGTSQAPPHLVLSQGNSVHRVSCFHAHAHSKCWPADAEWWCWYHQALEPPLGH